MQRYLAVASWHVANAVGRIARVVMWGPAKVVRWHSGQSWPRHHGITLVMTAENGSGHVYEALDLIAATSPWHLRLVQRYMPRLFLNQRRSNHGVYIPATDTGNLDVQLMLTLPVADTAARIVFAATMARLYRMGRLRLLKSQRSVEVMQRVMRDFIALRRRAAGVAP